MTKRTISTRRAPAAVGPYSQGVVAGGWLHVSGQIPLDPATGVLVEGGIIAQARRCLDNLRGVIEEAGSSMDSVVKVTIYLADLGDFGAVNTVYAGYFGAEPPARACVEVSRIPRDVGVEMDAVCYLGEGKEE